jgi:predicted O-methyltransferase YrrM
MADSWRQAAEILRARGPAYLVGFAARRLASYAGIWRRLRRLRRLPPDAALEPLISFMVERPDGPAQIVFAMQRPGEIAGLLDLVRELRPRVVVEIGTAAGGTLFLLTRVAAPDALVVSLDLPGGAFGGGYHPWRAPLYRSFARDRQRIVLLRGDSHAPRTRTRLLAALDAMPIDLLFIDGDHRYAGVKADFAAYARLVRPGGLVVFHDIVADPRQPEMEVARFWNEISARLPSHELVEQRGQQGYGLGVITIPDDGRGVAEALGARS